MPIYEYECKKCGETFEVMQKMSDPPLKQHSDTCKGKVQKQMSASALKFNGTGWYETDYKNKT